jgi:hypothetical protein
MLSPLSSQFDLDLWAVGSVSSDRCLSSFLASPSVNSAGRQLGSSAGFIFPVVLLDLRSQPVRCFGSAFLFVP